MRLSQCLERIDSIKPNAYSAEVKTGWISDCEGMIETEVMLLSLADVTVYDATRDSDALLCVPPPYDRLYLSYLTAMIDFANGEYDRYQNAMQLFNAQLGDYTRFYARTVRPADRATPFGGYAVSAYAIAVAHGFAGDEEAWLASLRGADGQNGQDGQNGVSPTVTLTETADGVRLTVTDALHPDGQTFLLKNGHDGTNGANGQNGTDGQDGVTPVRGVDYWTASDRAQIVQDVLDQLPDVDEEAY